MQKHIKLGDPEIFFNSSLLLPGGRTHREGVREKGEGGGMATCGPVEDLNLVVGMGGVGWGGS